MKTAVNIIDANKNNTILTIKNIGINFNPDLILPFLIVEIIIAASTELTPKLIKINILKSEAEIELPELNFRGKLPLIPEISSIFIFDRTSDIIIIILCERAYRNGAITMAATVINIT